MLRSGASARKSMHVALAIAVRCNKKTRASVKKSTPPRHARTRSHMDRAPAGKKNSSKRLRLTFPPLSTNKRSKTLRRWYCSAQQCSLGDNTTIKRLAERQRTKGHLHETDDTRFARPRRGSGVGCVQFNNLEHRGERSGTCRRRTRHDEHVWCREAAYWNADFEKRCSILQDPKQSK